jgi:hypothetical protein
MYRTKYNFKSKFETTIKQTSCSFIHKTKANPGIEVIIQKRFWTPGEESMWSVEEQA